MKILRIGITSAAVVACAVLLFIQGVNGMGDSQVAQVSDKSAPHISKSGHELARLPADRIKELATKLTPDERRIMLDEGTERACSGAFFESKDAGTYTCKLCGLPLFVSDAKFDSGTGWPSFFQPVDKDHVHYQEDKALGMVRTEIECQRCRGHLGHVFDDGPPPTGLRFCVNSASLNFYEQGAELPPESTPIKTETAYFAGGCFWGIEDKFQQVSGVLDVVSGYQGGTTPSPTYKDVGTGRSGHAETVRVVYDPKRVSYAKLLEWFFRFHDATQLNRQGPDIGAQYRSAIFAATDEQLEQAKKYTAELQKSDKYAGRQIATEITKATPFYEAEEYHQDYHAKHGGSCSIPTTD